MAIRQLTIRGFDKELEQRLREEARTGDLSLNRAALRLLRRGAGLDRTAPANTVGDGLDHLIGTWSDADEHALRKATVVFERVDKEFWR